MYFLKDFRISQHSWCLSTVQAVKSTTAWLWRQKHYAL